LIDAALSFVSEAEFASLIADALVFFSRAPKPAEAVFAYASLQYPGLLHPHLAKLFEMQPNARSYYENWPWREAGESALDDLVSRLSSPGAAARFKAWRCLLEMRTDSAMRIAIAAASDLELQHPVGAYLEEVGFSVERTPLYSSRVMHLIFPEGFFEAERPVWRGVGVHPSWRATSVVGGATLGGGLTGACDLCEQPLHRLLSFPADVSPSHDELTVAACLSCLGWEVSPLFYQHGSGGEITPLNGAQGRKSPEFVAAPLKQANVQLALTDERWRWQDWGLANSRENLNRVGGYPAWIQSANYPSCIVCSSKMFFLMQLDSDLPSSNGEEWQWGSGGICYVFWCAACSVTAIEWQCT